MEIHKECKNTEKGIKIIKCEYCGKNTFIQNGYQSICHKCSIERNLCKICGKEIIESE